MSVATAGGVMTFEQIVAGLDLTPHCEDKSCQLGHPQATHIRFLWMECHRSELYMCESCAARQLAILAKWQRKPQAQAWRCRKHGAVTHARLPEILTVRPL